MNWMKMYHDARSNKKLACLSDSQFRVWFNLLLYSSERDERGVIPIDDLVLLAIECANGDVSILTETIDKMVLFKMIDRVQNERGSSCIRFISFDKRQSLKPSDTPERVAERVRNHRANAQHPNHGESDCSYSINVTPCNAPVTPQIENVTPCNAPSNAQCNDTRIDKIRIDKNREEENHTTEPSVLPYDLSEKNEMSETNGQLWDMRISEDLKQPTPKAQKPDKKGNVRFVPPSLPEAVAYFIEQESTADEATRWFDRNTGYGWRTNSGPMKNWQGAARYWISNQKKYAVVAAGTSSGRMVRQDRTMHDAYEDHLKFIQEIRTNER